MKILGVDISSSITGWAVVDNSELISYGAIDIKSMKRDAVITNSMLWGFGEKIRQLLELVKPDHMAVENVYMGMNPQTCKSLAMMSGIARYISVGMLHNEVPTIYPSEVNKYYGIKGNPKRKIRKDKLVQQANKFFGTSFLKKDDDIADAIGIAFVAYHKLSRGNKIRYI